MLWFPGSRGRARSGRGMHGVDTEGSEVRGTERSGQGVVQVVRKSRYVEVEKVDDQSYFPGSKGKLGHRLKDCCKL